MELWTGDLLDSFKENAKPLPGNRFPRGDLLIIKDKAVVLPHRASRWQALPKRKRPKGQEKAWSIST